MRKFTIKNILNGSVPIDNKVIVQGWVRTRRDFKSNFSFISLYDGSCFNSLQKIVENTLLNYQDVILQITTGCCISVLGLLIKSIGLDQLVEVKAEEVTVLGWINKPETYPISAKMHSLEYLRSVGHLRPRTNIIGAVARVRHEAYQAINSFMNEQGFIWVATPLITASDAEGAGEMFRVSNFNLENLPYNSVGKVNYKEDFFGKEAFLTVSGQLNGEAYACALSKIYTFGPTFRAEHSNTIRHLAEFWMIEPEMAFANLDDISLLAEDFLKYIFNIILKKCVDDMNYFVRKVDKFAIEKIIKCMETKFIHINYSDIISLLQICGKNFKSDPAWGADLSYEHERYLVDEYFKSPIIIKNYPKNLKAFYMRLNDDCKTVAAMDILVPGIGEIIGGSQREERIEVLDDRLFELNLNKEDYWWYRDLRQYGTVPHSGFGLGFERLILYITGMKNIRDIIPFPRNRNNLNF